jgi:hypothetical protein
MGQVLPHQRAQPVGAERLEEGEAHQIGDVLGALAQRRHAQHGGRIEPHVQVGAEAPLAHQRSQILVGGRHQLGGRRARARIAQAGDHAALEHEEELPLQLEVEVGDLVEKERPAVGLLEDARVVLDGAGVGAPPRAEEMGGQQRGGDGAEIGDHQRALGARARMDDVLGEEALARARLPLDEHRQRRARQHAHRPPQIGHGVAAPPEHGPLLEILVRREGVGDLRGQAAAVHHLVGAEVDQRIRGPLGAELGRRGGEHHHRQLRVVHAQLLQNQQPLPPPQRLDGLAPRRCLHGEIFLVFRQEPLLGEGKMQIEDHQIRQGRAARQHLGRFRVVVRALERAAALPLLAHLAGDAPIAAGEVVELRQLPVAHLHRLIAIVYDQKPSHLAPPFDCGPQLREGLFEGQHADQIVPLGGSLRPSNRPAKPLEHRAVHALRRLRPQAGPERLRAHVAPLLVDEPGAQLPRPHGAAHLPPIARRPQHPLHQIVLHAPQPAHRHDLHILQKEVFRT